MTRSDWILCVVCIIGFFVAGLVWRPAFDDNQNIKYAMECTSYIATTLAAIVAIFALNAWKYQFKYTERFKHLSELKDAAAGLNAYIEYLYDFYGHCSRSIPNGGTLAWEHSDDGTLAQWNKALDRYRHVWAIARIFLTEAEVAGFSGKPEKFDELYVKNIRRLSRSVGSGEESDALVRLMESYQEVSQESWALYKSTLRQAEELLSKSR